MTDPESWADATSVGIEHPDRAERDLVERLDRLRVGLDGAVALKYWSATTVSAMRA
jgi:hypothetical protein